jgi:hypothetical protein
MKNHAIFWRLAETYCLNMAISGKKESLKSGNGFGIFLFTKFLCIYESLHILFWWSSAVDYFILFYFILIFWENFTPWRPKKNPLPKRVIRKNKFQNLPYFEGKKKKKKKVRSRHI